VYTVDLATPRQPKDPAEIAAAPRARDKFMIARRGPI